MSKTQTCPRIVTDGYCVFPDCAEDCAGRRWATRVTITLTQDQAEHALLCARMALAQAQLAALQNTFAEAARQAERRDAFAALCKALEAQITERV